MGDMEFRWKVRKRLHKSWLFIEVDDLVRGEGVSIQADQRSRPWTDPCCPARQKCQRCQPSWPKIGNTMTVTDEQ
jgi:hypothetical protein